MGMEKTTLYLPPELQRSLRLAARREGRSQADLVREALEQYLSGLRQSMPRSIGSGEDGELDGGEVKAWIRAEWDRR